MRYLKITLILCFAVILITGCGKSENNGKRLNTENSVNEVISDQMEKADEATDNKNTEAAEYDISLPVTETEDMGIKRQDSNTTEHSVDYDLAEMSSDMVYATVYQMMAAPQQYEGKTFRINGNFYASYYENTNKYYYYCIVQDAASCCAQGLEFVWEDGNHVYPDEYPEENTEVIVEGTFETYREDGDKNLYCRLCNATMQAKE